MSEPRQQRASVSEPRQQRASVSSATAEPLLVVEDLKTHFRTSRGLVRAVDGVSFTLERGRTLGIVGESGSGKTILSRSIMGLINSPNAVQSGNVRFKGTDVRALSKDERQHLWGREVAMVFQDPMTALNPVLRIGRQLTEHVRFHLGMDKAEAMAHAEHLLAEVGIPEPARRLNEYPHQLSGGMRQRVMIAISLACGPTLLFADEPTTALDVTIQAQILDLLAAEQRDRNMSLVLVTHDLGVVAGRTDDIAVMYAGRIVEKAPTRRLFSQMKMPYTEALLKSIPRLDQPSHTRLQIIGGRPPDLLNPPKGCSFSPRCPYAKARCHEEAPPLTEAEVPGHLYACWYPVGSPEWQAAQRGDRVAVTDATQVAAGGN